MKTHIHPILLLVSFLTLDSVSADLTRLSESNSANPLKNMARHNVGASITEKSDPIKLGTSTIDPNTAISALLKTDPTVGYPVSKGNKSIYINLNDIEVLQGASFVNEKCAGQVKIFSALTKTAKEENKWTAIGTSILSPNKRITNIAINSFDAKYLKLEWDISQPGKIYNFGVFGTTRAKEYKLTETVGASQATRTVSEDELININLLSAYTDSKVIYVSSGEGSPSHLIDGNSSTTYRFANTDKDPTVVIDLGQEVPLSRISALYDKTNTNLQLFTTNQLPQNNDWIGRSNLGKSDISSLTPITSLSDPNGEGRLASNLSSTGRYLIYKFSNPSSTNFGVQELAAFSRHTSAHTSLLRGGSFSSSGSAGINRGNLAYNGQLPSYSGSSFVRRGSSSGIARASSDTANAGVLNQSVDSAVFEEPSFESATLFEEQSQAQEVLQEIVVQVVSRIAVSETTVEGIGHLYENVGNGPAPEGFIFAAPAFEGTHEGGVIQAEILGEITTGVTDAVSPEDGSLPFIGTQAALEIDPNFFDE